MEAICDHYCTSNFLCYCSIVRTRKKCTNKYEKHFPKMERDVGMAVPKITETRHRDYYTSNPIPTSFLHVILLEATL